MRIRAVMLDATGVLIEPAESVGQTYATLARVHGQNVPAWRLEDAFRRVVRAAPPRVLDGQTGEAAISFELGWWRERVRQTFQAVDSTLRFDDFDAFFRGVFDHFRHAEAWSLRPGAIEAVTALRHAGLGTGVISNFDHRLPDLLEELGIASFLDVVMIPSACGAAKPDPAIFLAALALLGVEANEALYVGHDPVEDGMGAQRAGLIPLLLADGESLRTLPTRVAQTANLGGASRPHPRNSSAGLPERSATEPPARTLPHDESKG